VKVEIDKGMQQAQGPDMTMNKEDRAKTSSKTPPSGQPSMDPEEPITTEEGLAEKQTEEGKL
jgi:hypothetical protein